MSFKPASYYRRHADECADVRDQAYFRHLAMKTSRDCPTLRSTIIVVTLDEPWACIEVSERISRCRPTSASSEGVRTQLYGAGHHNRGFLATSLSASVHKYCSMSAPAR